MRSPSFRHSTEVQTVLFDVSAFTPATAKTWARSHGFRAPAGDVTARYIRLRQRDPSAYRAGTFRTITLTDGVQAVVGVPKTGGNLKPRKNPPASPAVLAANGHRGASVTPGFQAIIADAAGAGLTVKPYGASAVIVTGKKDKRFKKAQYSVAVILWESGWAQDATIDLAHSRLVRRLPEVRAMLGLPAAPAASTRPDLDARAADLFARIDEDRKPRKNAAPPEYVLWGLPKGATDALHQKILYTQGKTMADVERVKRAASLDGWHTFRVQTLDLSQPFNAGAAFAGSVRKNAGGSTRPTRTAQVTAYLAAHGFPGLKLHKGNGYLYVSGGGSETWPETSVMTYRVSDQTLDQWLSDVRRLAGGARRNGSLSAARARLLAAQEAYALLRRHHGGSMIGWAEYKRTVARMSPEAILAEAREDVNRQNPRRNTGAGAHYEEARTAIRRAIAARGAPDYDARYVEAAHALNRAERHREQTAAFLAPRGSVVTPPMATHHPWRRNAGYSRSTRPQVTCPKCYGAKRFSPYAHIAEGICFTCGGAGTVDETKERGGTITTPTPVASKTVTLPGFGQVTVTRSAGSRGSFRADFPYDSDAYGGVVYFNVRDGRVVDADTDNFSPSYKGQKAEIVAGLQAALKPRQNPRRNGAERVTVPGMGTGVVVAHRPGGMCDIRLSGGQVVRKSKSTLKPA